LWRFSDGVDVDARFAFGASVGFLRAWSVIHPLFWAQTIDPSHPINVGPWENHGTRTLAPASARALAQAGWIRCVGVLGARRGN